MMSSSRLFVRQPLPCMYALPILNAPFLYITYVYDNNKIIRIECGFQCVLYVNTKQSWKTNTKWQAYGIQFTQAHTNTAGREGSKWVVKMKRMNRKKNTCT